MSTMMPIAIGIRPGGKGLNKMNMMTKTSCSAFQEVIVSGEPSGLSVCLSTGNCGPLLLDASCEVSPPPTIKTTTKTAKITNRLTCNLPCTGLNFQIVLFRTTHRKSLPDGIGLIFFTGLVTMISNTIFLEAIVHTIRLFQGSIMCINN